MLAICAKFHIWMLCKHLMEHWWEFFPTHFVVAAIRNARKVPVTQLFVSFVIADQQKTITNCCNDACWFFAVKKLMTQTSRTDRRGLFSSNQQKGPWIQTKALYLKDLEGTCLWFLHLWFHMPGSLSDTCAMIMWCKELTKQRQDTMAICGTNDPGCRY